MSVRLSRPISKALIQTDFRNRMCARRGFGNQVRADGLRICRYIYWTCAKRLYYKVGFLDLHFTSLRARWDFRTEGIYYIKKYTLYGGR